MLIDVQPLPAGPLRAVVVREPWAWLIGLGLKRREHRSRRTLHRGPLLVVLSRTSADGSRSTDEDVGRAIAVCDVTGCTPSGTGWAWRLARPRLIVEPWPVKGRLGLFLATVPPGAETYLPDAATVADCRKLVQMTAAD